MGRKCAVITGGVFMARKVGQIVRRGGRTSPAVALGSPKAGRNQADQGIAESTVRWLPGQLHWNQGFGADAADSGDPQTIAGRRAPSRVPPTL